MQWKRIAWVARGGRSDMSESEIEKSKDQELDRLRERVRQLEEELSAVRDKGEGRRREKIAHMSAEVVDTNPYRWSHDLNYLSRVLFHSLLSRLMALKRMGIVDNYEVCIAKRNDIFDAFPGKNCMNAQKGL